MNEPLAVIALTIRIRKRQRGHRKLRVYIWKNVSDLRQAAKNVTGHGGWYDTAGFYLAARGPSKFGEIHLWKKLIGEGYWAHELQHFIADYSEETENEPVVFDAKANERMAFLAGDLTNQFWTKFYKRFKVQ